MMIRRLLFATVLLASTALAGPPLTTIQDVLYKADGTLFNGTLTISWNSFQAVDNSSIVTQTITVKVVNGNLRVQLVATATSTPPSTYSVTYNSDGRIQFQEIWSVPVSAIPLHLRDVRVTVAATGSGAGNDTGGGSSGPIPESQVTGLAGDLSARPLKGPALAAGRVAVVDGLGALESAVGNSSDCIHVDGSSSPCGGTAPSFIDADSPAGIVDGSNTVFNLSAVPSPATSLSIYRNGMLQKITQDFVYSGSTVQFVAGNTPQPGDTLLASYRMAGSITGSAPAVYSSPQVLCSGTGASTTSNALVSIGTCTVPAGVLLPGDRVEIRFDFADRGGLGGFSIEIHWGGTTIVHRDAGAGEPMFSGTADAGLMASSAQLSSQVWGAIAGIGTNATAAPDAYGSGIVIDFRGLVAHSNDVLSLGNFTVVRIP